MIPVLKRSHRNSNEPILKASPGCKLQYSYSNNILQRPQLCLQSKLRFLSMMLPPILSYSISKCQVHIFSPSSCLKSFFCPASQFGSIFPNIIGISSVSSKIYWSFRLPSTNLMTSFFLGPTFCYRLILLVLFIKSIRFINLSTSFCSMPICSRSVLVVCCTICCKVLICLLSNFGTQELK